MHGDVGDGDICRRSAVNGERTVSGRGVECDACAGIVAVDGQCSASRYLQPGVRREQHRRTPDAVHQRAGAVDVHVTELVNERSLERVVAVVAGDVQRAQEGEIVVALGCDRFRPHCWN